MARARHTVVGLGELLWDVFATEKKLGGAPGNFAYISSLLGDEGIPASRLGQDELGREALRCLARLGLPTTFIQEDATHPTGTVLVDVDEAGQPRFEICESVAWDFLAWTPEWQALAARANAVCFGSLAQRSPESRACIRQFLQAMRPEAIRIFDVNLRQHFFNAEILAESMKLASVVKLNHDELPRIMSLFELKHLQEESSALSLIELHDLNLVCITRGSGGSLLVTPQAYSSHPGFRVRVADTVGAGDAFTAALVHEYLNGASLGEMNEVANRVGSWVASKVGATPVPEPGELERTLFEVR